MPREHESDGDVPTMWVKLKGGTVARINKEDFDKEIHTESKAPMAEEDQNLLAANPGKENLKTLKAKAKEEKKAQEAEEAEEEDDEDGDEAEGDSEHHAKEGEVNEPLPTAAQLDIMSIPELKKLPEFCKLRRKASLTSRTQIVEAIKKARKKASKTECED